MTIASNIHATVTRNDVIAVTLEYGYSVHANWSRSLFDPARIESKRQNAAGRCTYLAAHYKDGSRLIFTWHPQRGARYRIA